MDDLVVNHCCKALVALFIYSYVAVDGKFLLICVCTCTEESAWCTGE